MQLYTPTLTKTRRIRLLALPRVNEYLTPEACAEALRKLVRDRHKLAVRLTKKQWALEDFGPKRTELEAEALALQEEVAYLDALLPKLPQGKTRSKREYRRAQAADAHSRCLRKLDKFSGPAHMSLQMDVKGLADRVAHTDKAIHMLEAHQEGLVLREAQEAKLQLLTQRMQEETALRQEAKAQAGLPQQGQAHETHKLEEEQLYTQAAKAMLLMAWCWQQAQKAAMQGANIQRASGMASMLHAPKSGQRFFARPTDRAAHRSNASTLLTSSRRPTWSQDLCATRPPPDSG